MLISYNPDTQLSELIRAIKSNSSKFINENHLVHGKFQWQNGYGAFTYSTSQVDTISNYIKNQENHHKKVSFHEEYREILGKFKIKYDDKYVFDLKEGT